MLLKRETLKIIISSFFFFPLFIFAQEILVGEGQVYVCPLATKTEEINPRCQCRIDLTLGEKITSTCGTTTYEMTLTIQEYNGQQYYAIYGFENGGAGVNLKPEAKITSPPEGTSGEEIIFSASQSSDPNSDPLDFYWDFGDGTNDQGENISHVYNEPGTYFITLSVSDGLATSTATATINILEKQLEQKEKIKKFSSPPLKEEKEPLKEEKEKVSENEKEEKVSIENFIEELKKLEKKLPEQILGEATGEPSLNFGTPQLENLSNRFDERITSYFIGLTFLFLILFQFKRLFFNRKK